MPKLTKNEFLKPFEKYVAENSETFSSKLLELGSHYVDKRDSLHEATGISEKSITGYESGDHEPTFHKIKQIANHFEIPAGFFFSTLSVKDYIRLAEKVNEFQLYEDLDNESQKIIVEAIKGFRTVLIMKGLNSKKPTL